MPNKKEVQEPKKKEAPQKTTKRLVGTALRDSISKTVPVQISQVRIHPLYQKRYNVSRKILAHTDAEVKKNQQVVIEESKRVSKSKAWKVVSVK